MSHRQIKTREGQLHHIVLKIWSEFGTKADVEQLKRVPKELFEELTEWYEYWHKKESK